MSELLEVSPEEFNDIREWTTLPEGEFLSRMYLHYPRLRRLPPYTEVKLVVIWDWKQKYRPSDSFARKSARGGNWWV